MSDFSPDRYWEERLANGYDERGVGDITLPRSYNAFLYRVRRKVFRRAVAIVDLIPSTSSVLDIGFGTGVYIEEWLRWGSRDIAGVDITSAAVAKLSVRFPELSLKRADIGDSGFSFDSRVFDAVSAFDVFFHIVDDSRFAMAIRNVSRMLRPGGWFLYSDNLPRHATRMEHYVRRTETTVMNELKSAGFEVVRRMPMFVLMNAPSRSSNRVRQRTFQLIHDVISGSEALGAIAGSVLYPPELLLTAIVRNAPSTEVLVCRKIN